MAAAIPSSLKTGVHQRREHAGTNLSAGSGSGSENQRECEALYQQQYQAGFPAGFHHQYQQWLIQLDEWADLQKELAQQLAEDLTALFIQPSIVEFIVKQLIQTTGIDVSSVVVLQVGITPPDSLPHINCILCNDDNFVVKQGERIVRFPQDRLCRQ